MNTVHTSKMRPHKPKPVKPENIPALLKWIQKHNLTMDQVRQVYFMSAEIEEELKSELVKNYTKDDLKYNLPVDYDSLHWKEKREVREQYIKIQNGKCFYCKCNLKNEPPNTITSKKIKWKCFPKNFLKHPVHLQHNHNTGMTEGAVHAYCNAVLWQYEGR